MTLLMRDQENIEKGILAMLAVLRDFNVPEDLIIQKIQEKFGLSKEKTKEYL